MIKDTRKGMSGGKKRLKRKTHAQLKKELDKLHSIFVRTKYSKNGICLCYTCNKPMAIKEAHCGHFISRTYLSTRWNENNTRPQCPGCNLFGGGKPLDFEENLKEELGEDVIESMKQSRHQILKLSPAWYLDEIEKYKLLIVKMNT